MTSESECSSTETSERTTASLSHMRACSGKCSQICTPGTLVGDRLELAAELRRGVGLEVVHVHVRRAAGQVDHDRGLVRGPLQGGRSCAAFSRSMSASVRPAPKRANLQEVPAAHAVAVPLLVAPERQHQRSPNGEKAGGWGGNRRCRGRASRPAVSTSKRSLNDLYRNRKSPNARHLVHPFSRASVLASAELGKAKFPSCSSEPGPYLHPSDVRNPRICKNQRETLEGCKGCKGMEFALQTLARGVQSARRCRPKDRLSA